MGRSMARPNLSGPASGVTLAECIARGGSGSDVMSSGYSAVTPPQQDHDSESSESDHGAPQQATVAFSHEVAVADAIAGPATRSVPMAMPNMTDPVELCECGLPVRWSEARGGARPDGSQRVRRFVECPMNSGHQCRAHRYETQVANYPEEPVRHMVGDGLVRLEQTDPETHITLVQLVAADEQASVHLSLGEPVGESSSQSAAGQSHSQTTQAVMEMPAVDAHLSAGKVVLSIAEVNLAEVRANSATNSVELHMLRPPVTWFGDKAGTTRQFNLAKKKVTEDADGVAAERADAAGKIVKGLKREGKTRGVYLAANAKTPIRNAHVGQLMVVATDVLRAVYMPGYMATQHVNKQAGSVAPAQSPKGGVNDPGQLLVIVDSGTNTDVASRRTAKAKGVGVNANRKYKLSGIEPGKPRITDGETETPLPLEIVDVDGQSVPFGFKAQVTDMGDTDDQQKGLIDVVNTLVFAQDMEVTFRKNKNGEMGHFMRKRDSGQMFPLHCSRDRLPVLPVKGLNPTHTSRPDSLEEYADVLRAAARSDSRHVNAVSKAVHAEIKRVLQEAPGSSSSDDDFSSSEEAWSSDSMYEDRKVRSRGKAHASKGKAQKSRRKAVRALLGASDLHNVLHRGKKQTRMTFGVRGVRVQGSDGKAVSGEDLDEDFFDVPDCAPCMVTRVKANPTRRSGTIHH